MFVNNSQTFTDSEIDHFVIKSKLVTSLTTRWLDLECFFCLGIWGSFYAILLQRVLKEEKQIKTEQDNEQQLLGNDDNFILWLIVESHLKRFSN